ncbi:MAG: hypothetical protein ACXV7D_10775 [Thermoanaerobaculia bacterium]
MLKRDAGAAAMFVALAMLMTWPLARIITRGVAYPGDPYHLTWVIDWDWFATFHRPLHLFNANIFFPVKNALAYSEHLYGIAIFLFPLRMIGISALTAHNVAVIIGFAFSAFGAYLLARTLTGCWIGSIAAGVFYAYLPWRFTQLPHLQNLWAGWPPLLLLALVFCARVSGWKSAILFGAAFFLNGLSNLHYFVFASFAAMLSVPLLVTDRKQWLRILAATLIACALLAPFLVPYVRLLRETGLQRSWQEVKSWSATPRDWLNPGATARAYRRFFDPSTDPERWLFPGAFGIAIALAGVVAARHNRRILAVALLWLALGFLGSLGVHTFFHRFLYSHVPGFRGLRVPARWAIDAYVAMSLLVAYGSQALMRHRRGIGVAIAIVFVIELNAAPIRWHCTSPAIPQVYRWLRTERGPIAELPVDTDSEYRYMRFATEHHLRTVNGISSFVPESFFRVQNEWMDVGKRDALLDDLRARGVRLVILHGDGLPKNERGWLRGAIDAGRLTFVRRFDQDVEGDWVFSFEGVVRHSPDLDRYLRGDYTYNESTFGWLDYPHPNELLKKDAMFSGWAMSPWGIHSVNLLFDNGSVRVPARLVAEPSLNAAFPWYDATTTPRFLASIPRKPWYIGRDTDVQVEIIDGRGERTLLEGRWFWWDR